MQGQLLIQNGISLQKGYIVEKSDLIKKSCMHVVIDLVDTSPKRGWGKEVLLRVFQYNFLLQ